MASKNIEAESLIKGDRNSNKQYGAVDGMTSEDDSCRQTYSEYHKVCDMRKVFDASPVAYAGIMLTFLLVFTSWCAWHEVIEWIGVKTNLEGQALVEFAAIVNGVAVLALIVILLLMRFTVGPILSYHWRSVFAVLLVLTAIAVWEAMEACFDMLLGSDSGERGSFYLIACGIACFLTFSFERIFHYDVIGNHLLTPP